MSKINEIKDMIIKKNEISKCKNKKSIENLIFLFILLVIIIIFINYTWRGDKKKVNESNKVVANFNDNGNNEVDIEYDNNDLELKLKNILERIEGVGQVEVLLTYSQTSTINPVYNENSEESITEEEDTNGGKRKVSSINNKKEVINDSNGIVTRSVTSPEIKGAIVTAKGASNINVKTNIIQAVEAITGLSKYKIQVFEMK